MRKIKIMSIVLILATALLFLLSSCTQNNRDGIAQDVFDVNDTVVFGTYEQDDDEKDGTEEIKWRVVAKEDDKVLLLSEKCLDVIPYNETEIDVTWETSTLRAWLNGEFYDNAFSDDEKARIAETVLVNSDNVVYGTDGGNDTSDKVFILSTDEANGYYAYEGSRVAGATDYAKAKGIYVWDRNKMAAWWLRTPGDFAITATVVRNSGAVHDAGHFVTDDAVGVRPAIWIRVI